MLALNGVQEGEDDQRWRQQARCADGLGTLTELFFSEQLDDIARAKEFCAECPVQVECLSGALSRQEPWGVWGGQLIWKGRVLAQKRRRGRPPLPRDPVTGDVIRDPVRIGELRAQAQRQALDLEAEVALIAKSA